MDAVEYDTKPKLLAAYYGFRALSIAALPYVAGMRGLLLFAVLYGLDWIATVPPTYSSARCAEGELKP